MTREYYMKYEPAACPINPSFKVVQHKTRAYLHEVNDRNRYRRSLSALLNSRPVDPLLDRSHNVLNNLHNYEQHLSTKVSAAAPSKDH